MTDGGGRSQDHQLIAPQAAQSATPTVRVCSLADVLTITGREKVALLKCDIEGSEYDLINNASPEVLRRIQRYAIEYHDHIRPGTLELLRTRLGPTHLIDIKAAPNGVSGMLYAVVKPE